MNDHGTCRICLGEASAEEPLFYPCKCKGSIRYVHQECLLEWLQSCNKKPVCDLCKTPFTFKKLYLPNRPKHMPLGLLLRRSVVDIIKFCRTGARVALAIFQWLIFLPVLVSFALRQTHWLIEGMPLAQGQVFLDRFFKIHPPRSERFVDLGILTSSDSEFVKYFLDVLEGGIFCAVLIIAVFVVTLLREWILQNEGFAQKLQQVGRPLLRRHQEGDEQQQQQQPFELLERAMEEHQHVGVEIREQAPEPLDAAQDLLELPRDPLERPPEDLLRPELPANNNRWVAQVEVEEDWENADLDALWDFLGFRGPVMPMFIHFGIAVMAISVGLTVLFCIPYTAGWKIMSLALCDTIPALQVVWKFIDREAEKLSKLFLTLVFDWLDLPHRAQALRAQLATRDSLEHAYRTWSKEFSALAANLHRRLCTTLLFRIAALVCGYFNFMSILKVLGSRRAARYLLIQPGSQRQCARLYMMCEAVMKVLLLMLIELVGFPLFCGFLLHLSLLPLLKDMSISRALSLIHDSPLIVLLCYSLIGTFYMFQFAVYVLMCRRIMRPGVLYFVRDSHDPEFQPIHEILDRTLLHQLFKIGISAMVYSFLICVGVGGISYFLRRTAWLGILPLAADPFPWRTSPSHLGLLLFISPLVALKELPFSANRPKFWTPIIHKSCEMLRLSSFILGKERPQERGSVYYKSWLSWFSVRPDYSKPTPAASANHILETDGVVFVPDGSFVRAPNTDSLRTDKSYKLFVPVTKDNERLDGIEDQQDTAFLENYRVVYRPPHFRWRILAFLLILWTTGIAAGLYMALVPLLLGRHIISGSISYDPQTGVSDIVHYISGIVPAMAVYWVLKRIKPFIHNISLQNITRRLTSKQLINCVILLLASLVFPTCVEIMADLVLLTPLRVHQFHKRALQPGIGDPLVWPSLHLSITPSLILRNMTSSVIYYFAIRGFLSRNLSALDNWVFRALRDIGREGLLDFDRNVLWLEVILPISRGLALWLLVAFLLRQFAVSTTSVANLDGAVVAKIRSLPQALGFLLMIHVLRLHLNAFLKWESSTLDEIYLEKEQLQNLAEPDPSDTSGD